MNTEEIRIQRVLNSKKIIFTRRLQIKGLSVVPGKFWKLSFLSSAIQLRELDKVSILILISIILFPLMNKNLYFISLWLGM